MKRENVNEVLNLLIGELGIPVTRQTVEDEIARHPEHNSMLAISDLLNNWCVPNAAYQLNFDELASAKIVTPFIAYLANKKFVLVSQLNEKEVIVSNEEWSKHRLKVEDFKRIYANGFILIAEKETDSGEADYTLKRRKESLNKLRMPFVIMGVVAVLVTTLLLYTSYAASINWQIALLTFLKTIGLATAILLLIQSIDTNNPLVQKLCGGDNKNNCNAILSSKAAKISEELSWSEIGVFYFTGTWLVLLLGSSYTNIIQALAILNIISLPYTVYSINYQWRIAKQWCRLCCTIQALLWMEFFVFLPYLLKNVQASNIREWGILLIGMALPVLAWIFIKPYLLLSKQIQPLKVQLRKFKYNAALFNKLLSEEVKYRLPDDDQSIILGNREAEHIITMVSNPYCQPCSKAHKALDEWLLSRNNIKLQIIFSNQTNENDPLAKIGPHLMALQANRDDISLKQALNDWYGQKQKNYNEWAKHHPVINNVSSKEALQTQREWCNITETKSTPAIFINGRKLPGNYQAEDIKYFI